MTGGLNGDRTRGRVVGHVQGYKSEDTAWPTRLTTSSKVRDSRCGAGLQFPESETPLRVIRQPRTPVRLEPHHCRLARLVLMDLSLVSTYGEMSVGFFWYIRTLNATISAPDLWAA